MITVLDPAHGGNSTSGKSTPNGRPQADGRPEKLTTLELARLVSGQLGDAARLTREEDRNPSLGERISVARNAHATVFLSLHVHAPGRSRRQGSSAWIHSAANDASAHLAGLVQREISGMPPEVSSLEVPRGELAVLTPERHDPATAACLVDLEVTSADDSNRLAAALGRAVQAHGARYGRGGVAVALAGEEIVFADSDAAMTYIADTMKRETNFLAGVGDTRIFPFSAICKLNMTDLNGDVWQGSGFYIANDLILTVGHNIHYYGLDNRPVGTRGVEVIPGLNGTERPFGGFSVAGSACHIHPNWFNGTDHYDLNYDLAVIETSVPPPNGQFFDYLDDSLTSRSTVAVVGYASRGVDPTRQHFDIDMIRQINDGPAINRASFQARVRKGTSGSPVFWVQSVDDPVQQVCRMETGVCGVLSTSGDTRGDTSDGMNTCCLMTPEKTTWILGRNYGSRRRGVATSSRQAPVRASTARPSAAPNRRLAIPTRTTGGAGFRNSHGAHERYGRAGAKALDEPYFTDEAELGAQLADRRQYDTRVVTNLADSTAVVDCLRNGTGTAAWTDLSRSEVADDLSAMLANPDIINQGGLNLCGPCAFLNMWAKRDPVAVANFAWTLYENGSAWIGNQAMAITPRDSVLTNNYHSLRTAVNGRGYGMPGPAIWMILAALRDDDNAILAYAPTSMGVQEMLAASTMPETIAAWMNATGIWNVRNEADWTHLLPSHGIPHATNLYEFDGSDVAVLINSNLMVRAQRTATTVAPDIRYAPDDTFLLNQFPNHFVVLRNSPVVNVATNRVELKVWSWGTYYELQVPQDVFVANYYGAVIGRLKS